MAWAARRVGRKIECPSCDGRYGYNVSAQLLLSELYPTWVMDARYYTKRVPARSPFFPDARCRFRQRENERERERERAKQAR